MIHLNMHREAQVFCKLLDENSPRLYGSVAHCQVKSGVLTITATNGFQLVQYTVRDLNIDVDDQTFLLPKTVFTHMAKKKTNTITIDGTAIFGGTYALDLGKFGYAAYMYPKFERVIPEATPTGKGISSTVISFLSPLLPTEVAIYSPASGDALLLKADNWLFLTVLTDTK